CTSPIRLRDQSHRTHRDALSFPTRRSSDLKESEPGHKDINVERIEDVLESKASIVAAACPFCMTMIRDGVKVKEKEQEIQVLDIDRKSTRLNSSHVKSSYAVFCLKKKKRKS